ncbi:Flp pilus assembly protein CpaB [candidate division KSB1 bacterium]|nr:Flp pilus assembly protein CpaB [candidate division KSB1 bacterium]
MLKMKFIIPFAVLFATLATYGVYQQMKDTETPAEGPPPETQMVVVAKTQLGPGRRLIETDLEIREWPKNLVPSGSFDAMNKILGRVVQATIYTGEAILNPKLSVDGSEGGFVGIIPPGMRAFTIAVDTYSGVSGFILPNTHVDVLVTVPSHVRKEDSSARMILEDVQVLAVDQTFERKGDEPVSVQSITLLVTPQDAEKLALASAEGNLQLSLRNTSDHSVTKTYGTRLRQMIAYTPRRTTVNTGSGQKTSDWIVEVIRSNERSEVTFKEKSK